MITFSILKDKLLHASMHLLKMVNFYLLTMAIGFLVVQAGNTGPTSRVVIQRAPQRSVAPEIMASIHSMRSSLLAKPKKTASVPPMPSATPETPCRIRMYVFVPI